MQRIHGCSEIRNFSLSVQHDLNPVNQWSIELNTCGENSISPNNHVLLLVSIYRSPPLNTINRLDHLFDPTLTRASIVNGCLRNLQVSGIFYTPPRRQLKFPFRLEQYCMTIGDMTAKGHSPHPPPPPLPPAPPSPPPPPQPFMLTSSIAMSPCQPGPRMPSKVTWKCSQLKSKWEKGKADQTVTAIY